MYKFFYALVFSIISISSFAQIQDIADKVLILRGEPEISKNEKLELDTLWKALKFYRKFEEEFNNIFTNQL